MKQVTWSAALNKKSATVHRIYNYTICDPQWWTFEQWSTKNVLLLAIEMYRIRHSKVYLLCCLLLWRFSCTVRQLSIGHRSAAKNIWSCASCQETWLLSLWKRRLFSYWAKKVLVQIKKVLITISSNFYIYWGAPVGVQHNVKMQENFFVHEHWTASRYIRNSWCS